MYVSWGGVRGGVVLVLEACFGLECRRVEYVRSWFRRIKKIGKKQQTKAVCFGLYFWVAMSLQKKALTCVSNVLSTVKKGVTHALLCLSSCYLF